MLIHTPDTGPVGFLHLSNSASNRLEFPSQPQAKGSVSQDCPQPLRHHQFQVEVITCASEQPAIRQKFPNLLLLPNHLLERLIELEKHLHSPAYYVIENINEQLYKEVKGRDPEGSLCRIFCPHEVGVHHLSGTRMSLFTNPEVLWTLCFWVFNWDFITGMINY